MKSATEPLPANKLPADTAEYIERMREALHECERLARSAMEGFKEDLPRALGFIEQIAQQAQPHSGGEPR